jgi:anti-sigma factor (TIGR02949 family)
MTDPNSYNCRDAFRRIHDYVDRELSPDELRRVREHLDVCARCAREFRFEAEVLASIRDALRRVEVPDRFREAVATALRDSRRP